MKKILLSIIYFFACIFFIQAQTLYGITSGGGNYGGGTISKFTPATNDLTVVKSFDGMPAANAQGNLIQASDGKFYGMSYGGGNGGNGTIFSFDPTTSNYKKLKVFDVTNGGRPFGSLMQASDGKLYGMTSDGGNSRNGVIFSFDPFSLTYTKLRDFDGINGGSPHGSFIQAGDGKLYGMTYGGGSNSKGVIFSFDPASSNYTKLKDFDDTNGAHPEGELMKAGDGKFYGMTAGGGSNNAGTIFSFEPASSNYTKLKDFGGADGANPSGSMMQANDGKLYGMTYNGGINNLGVIFSFDALSFTYTVLKDFFGTDGAWPHGSLIQANDGKLYGMTTIGGDVWYPGDYEDQFDNGVIFSLDPSSADYKVLLQFDATNGDRPQGSLMQASNGKLYGLTSGSVWGRGNGVIFSFDPNDIFYSKVSELDFGISNPRGSLVQSNNGKLYGISTGNSTVGIFSFDPLTSASAYTDVSWDVSYSAENEFTLLAALGTIVAGIDGKLYGLVYEEFCDNDGCQSYAQIYSFDPSTSEVKRLAYYYLKYPEFGYDGSPFGNGGYPFGNLMQAKDGKLYGNTDVGPIYIYPYGSYPYGNIFSFDPSSSGLTILKSFTGADGAGPQKLMQAANGKLYGMTSRGGTYEKGVIFSFDPTSSVYTKLFDFNGINGAEPFGALIQAKDGKLFGTASRGGINNEGVIFSYDPLTSIYTKLKDLDSTNGSNPLGNLMQASDGKLYGMTHDGGSKNLGVIFSFDPTTSTYTKLKDYTGANGANPFSAFIEIKEPNKPPTVKITSPVEGASYTAPATIILSADASDVDGKVKTVSFYNGNTLIFTEDYPPFSRKWLHVPVGEYSITAVATDDSGLVTTSAPVHISVVPNKPPTVKITSPVEGASYTALATIILSADASDVDGKVETVSFYNGNTLIFTEDYPPFSRKWLHVPVGNYSITAKATDDKGKVTTSEAVNISVVPNKPPMVKITSPANGTSFTSPATIRLSAEASDIDGTIRTVDFYNGNTLLFTEKQLPYSREWFDVPGGNYSITAKATDNNGKTTTSAPIVISVAAASKSIASGGELNSNRPLSLNVNPNPVSKTLNISIDGLQTNSRSAISLISVSGVVIKTIQSNTLDKNVQLDVSSLSAGVYFIKLTNGDKVLYKEFVKL